MPQIPLTQRPDLIQTAPAGRFMNGNAFQAAPIQAREYISPGAGVNALGRGVAGALDAGAEFFKKAQESTDYISTQEAHRFARNQIDAFHADLQNRTDYENFSKDYQEKLKSVEEGVQPFLDKASNPAKMMFQQQFSDLTEGAAVRTRAFAQQRMITNNREASMGLIEDRISAGDPEGAKVEKNKSISLGLFHSAESDKIDRQINSKIEFNGIAKAIQSGSAKIESGRLMEMNDDGSYKNYPNIHVNDRLNLKREADNVDIANENQASDYLRHEFMVGSLTQETIDKMPVSPKTKDNFTHDLKQRALEIKKGEYETKKAEWTDASEKLSFAIDREKFSDNKQKREAQKAKYLEMIENLNLPIKTRHALYNQLDTRFKEPKEAENKGLVYDTIKKKIKDAYESGFNKNGSTIPGSGFGVMTVDSPWHNWANDQYATPVQQYGAYVRLDQGWNEAYKNNPKMSPEESVQWFDTNYAIIRDPKVITNLQNVFAPKTDFTFAEGLDSGGSKNPERLPGKTNPNNISKNQGPVTLSGSEPTVDFIGSEKVDSIDEPSKQKIKTGDVVNGWKFKGGDSKVQDN